MKLHVLFEQPEESYAGQYAPVAIAIIDEYTAENFGSLTAAKEEEVTRLFKAGDFDPAAIKWAWLEVDLGATEQLIRDTILRPTPVIAGSVAVPAPPPGQKHPSYESIKVTRGVPGAGRIVDDEIVE